jgi:hypothetical protein
MALEKSIPNPFGFTTKYWKLTEINKNWLEGHAHVVMLGWHSQEARDEYPAIIPMDSRAYDWSQEEFPFVAGENEIAAAYAKIKSLTTVDVDGNVVPGEFADAIDV